MLRSSISKQHTRKCANISLLHVFFFLDLFRVRFIIHASWWKSIYQHAWAQKRVRTRRKKTHWNLHRWWSLESVSFHLNSIWQTSANDAVQISHVLFDKYRFTQQWETIHADQTSEMKQTPHCTGHCSQHTMAGPQNRINDFEMSFNVTKAATIARQYWNRWCFFTHWCLI